MEVECPVEGCDYQDSVRSVQGHVTASTGDEHDGLHGMDVAQSLREQAEARLNGELPRLDDAVDGARNAVNSAVDGVVTRPGSEEDEPAEPEQATAGSSPGSGPAEPEVEPVEEIETGNTDDGSEFGIPVPVDGRYIVAGAVLLMTILVLRARSQSDPGGTDETDDSDAPRDGVVVESGGLLGDD